MALELPVVPSCYFCDIVAEPDGQWQIWAEDESTLTLLNGRQYEVGQSIVISRRHCPTLLDLDAAELAALMHATQRASRVVLAAFDPDGILIYQNNGVGSGQEVPHVHVHVVPRQPGSDWGFGPPHLAELDRRATLPKFRHDVETEEKTAAVDLLRRTSRSIRRGMHSRNASV